MNVTATMILGEAHWEIRVPLGIYASKQAGQEALNSATAEMATVDGRPSILLTVTGQRRHLTDGETQIRELSKAARARLGEPLDVSTSEGKEAAIAALVTMNASYVVHEDDFVPSEMTLYNLLEQYGEGYLLDHIGDELR